jgi:hypothetical protein
VFRKIVDLPSGDSFQQTVSFAPVHARIFRVTLKGPEAHGYHEIAELVLHCGARVNRFEDKAGYSVRSITDTDDTPAVPDWETISRREIVDLTSSMREDGSLSWAPPPGHWKVLRFGYSLIGRRNHPATQTGTGLEVDKLNRMHVKSYLDAYLGEYEKTLGAELLGRQGLRYMLIDSYEAETQNWTNDLPAQFQQRRGYGLTGWLPVLAGRVVDSAEASDRFLWDFRRTLSELMIDAHYGQLAASLHQRGMGTYGEAHEYGPGFRAFIGDGMDAKRTADVPMGAMWAGVMPGWSIEGYDADIRESASVAHIYGKPFVAAEAFTAFANPYGYAPRELKPYADRMLAMGVNRFVVHTSVHQPDSKLGPGIGLGPFGQWFTRKETWAEQAGAWMDYLTRSSYLLQQGRSVADIAWLYGEDTNVAALFHARAPAVPEGYSYDFINRYALLNELTVKDGVLVTRAGMTYRVLVLDASTQRISVPVLRKLRDLVTAGAIVVGTKPVATPSLADDPNDFRALVTQLWDGKRVWESIPQALRRVGVSPDLTIITDEDTSFHFVHRALNNGHVYFLSNATGAARTIEACFRVSGKKPEVWRANSGTIEPVSYRSQNGRTIVPLEFEANDALFVVFRRAASTNSLKLPERSSETLASIQGSWDVSFQPARGAPARARFEKLDSWTQSSDAGIKYFSGTAAYSRVVRISRRWLQGSGRIQLNLGELRNLAEVFVNGRSMGVLWSAPFRLDITNALKAGDNRIEIKVTNLWANRLIGDKQPGAKKLAYSSYNPFEADSPLFPSGLFGPVVLVREIVTSPQ